MRTIFVWIAKIVAKEVFALVVRKQIQRGIDGIRKGDDKHTT
jgi:hypothetical protein